jgi:anti-sigma B factor antagonist
MAPVCIEGAMTLARARTLKQALLEHLERQPRLDLDLSAVSELDTAGVQLLLMLKRAAADAGKPLAIDALSPAARQILSLFDLGACLALPASDPMPSEDTR